MEALTGFFVAKERASTYADALQIDLNSILLRKLVGKFYKILSAEAFASDSIGVTDRADCFKHLLLAVWELGAYGVLQSLAAHLKRGSYKVAVTSFVIQRLFNGTILDPCF